KSTNVSVGHSLARNSSRVTSWPGRSSSIARTSNGCPTSLSLTPCLRSSPARRSASNGPNRTGLSEMLFSILRRGQRPIRILAALVAVAAMIGPGATFPGGTLPKVHAQEEDLQACSAKTLNGIYALTFSGFGTRGPVPAAINDFTPVAGGGLVTFDGNGNLSASETVS